LIDASGRALLADFGIGHTFASARMVVGSPAFQAPEALNDSYGDCDCPECCECSDGPQKEDVWALGVTLYQLLFNTLPYCGNNLYEIVSDIMTRPLAIPDGVNSEIVKLFSGMLNGMNCSKTQCLSETESMNCHQRRDQKENREQSSYAEHRYVMRNSVSQI
jgi:serine/threonine protein kinase